MARAGTGTRTAARVDELLALYETTQEICSRLDVDLVLSSIVRRANQLVGGDVAYLATVDDEQGVLRMRAFDNIRTEAFRQLVMRFGVGLGGSIAAERRPMSTRDYLTDESLSHAGRIDEAVTEEGIRAAVGVPVEFEGVLLAILFVAKRREARFTPHQVTLLSSLANSAAIALHNAQLHARLTSAMSVHDRFMALSLSNQGLPAIVATLAELIDGPVVLRDWSGRLLADSGSDWTARGSDDDARNAQVHAIHVAGRMDAELTTEPRARDATLSRIAAQQAVTAIALELGRLRSAEQTEAALRGDLLDQLLRRPLPAEHSLRRDGQRLGVDLTAPHAVAVLRQTTGVNRGESGLWERVAQLACFGRGSRPELTPISRGDSLVLLARATHTEQAATQVSALLSDCRQARLGPMVAGVGSVRSQLVDYATSLAEADRAVAVAARSPDRHAVLQFDRLPYHQVVLGARPLDLRGLAHDLLAPLVEHDGSLQGGPLMSTLRAYLARCGNLEATARELHIHPNTMRGRAARIEALLGLDLQSALARLDLHLALVTLDLQQGTRDVEHL